MHSMLDAAIPPAVAPAGFQAVAGYLGDPNFTPHVWTPAEWGRFAGLRKLPIWVYNPKRPAADQAGDCLLQLHNLGFTSRVRRWGATWRTPVVLDLEMAKVKMADVRFTEILNMAGYLVIPYGSASTVFANPGYGYWVADWTHTPHMFPGDNVHATQWTNGKAVDSSLVRWKLWKRLH